MKLDSIIRYDFVIVSPLAGVISIKQKLIENSALVVMEEGQYFGVLTLNDIVKKPHILVIDCLYARSEVRDDNSIDYVLNIMKYENTDVLPVFKDSKIIGLIFKNDIIDQLNKVNKELSSIIDEQNNHLKTNNSELKEIIAKQKFDLENIIEQRTKELIDLVETKDRFIQLIAHKLLNPFAAILGFLNLLKKNIRNYETEKIELYLTQIYRGTSVTFDLLVNLSEWLDIKNKQMPYDPTNINIYNLLNDEVLTNEGLIEENQISLENEITSNIFVYADRTMLRTVLKNLVNNAIKYTDTGGKINISASKTGDFVEIKVKDTGIGITPEIIENLFKLEDIGTTNDTKSDMGMRLGLLICKEYIEIEGGKIWVESILNNGTEFKFTIPAGQAA